MTKTQEKFLIGWIDSLRWRTLPSPKDPSPIRAMRNKLQRYDQKVARVMQERTNRAHEARHAAREVVYSGDYDTARAAIKKFESQKF